MKHKSVLFITRTALFLALLIMLQWMTKPLGQFVTGSAVNFVLLSATLLSGLSSGIIIAVISPLLAFFFGIGPALIQLIPMIALGNLVFVLIFGLMLRKNTSPFRWVTASLAGAFLKFGCLYLGIVYLVLPLIPGIPEKQMLAISATFGWPQLVTALIGAVLCWLLIPTIQKALRLK